MATQGSGSIAHMGTLVSRRRQGGSLGYTAPSVSTGRARASTPDRRGLIAALWPPNGCGAGKPNWTRCGPMASRGARADPRRLAAGVRGGDEEGRQSPRVLHAVRSLGHRRPTARVAIEDVDGTQISGPRVLPYNPRPVGANVGIAFPRTPTRSHLAPVRTRLRHPGSPNSPCMSPGDLEAVHPSPARARAGAARRESLTGAGCRRSGPTNPSRLGF
jgi:hypothetical protein